MSDQVINVMLLAAGEGMRLRPFTLQMPKPAIPFLTCPLAAYSLNLLSDIKINNLVVNIHHLPEQIQSLMPKLVALRKSDAPDQAGPQKLHFSDETHELLGSGGGIHQAKNFLMGTEIFMVLNADEVILPEKKNMMTAFVEGFRQSKDLARLLVMEHAEVGHKFGGVWCSTPQGNPTTPVVAQFAKKSPGENFRGYHFIGPMLFRDRIFNYFKPLGSTGKIAVENILYETLTLAISKGESVSAVPINCSWFETGNPGDFLSGTQEALSLLSNGQDSKSTILKSTIQKFGGRKPLIERGNATIEAHLRKLSLL